MFGNTHIILNDGGINQVFEVKCNMLNDQPFKLIKDNDFDNQHILCMFTDPYSARTGFLNADGTLILKNYVCSSNSPNYYNIQKKLKKIIAITKFRSNSFNIYGLDFNGIVWTWSLNSFSKRSCKVGSCSILTPLFENIEINEKVLDIIETDRSHRQEAPLLFITEKKIIVYCYTKKIILREYTHDEIGIIEIIANEFMINDNNQNFLIKSLDNFSSGQCSKYFFNEILENNSIYSFSLGEHLEIPGFNETVVYKCGTETTINGHINAMYASEHSIVFSTTSNNLYIYFVKGRYTGMYYEFFRADGVPVSVAQISYPSVKKCEQ